MRERDELDEHMGVHRVQITHFEHEFFPGQDRNHIAYVPCVLANKQMCTRGQRRRSSKKKTQRPFNQRFKRWASLYHVLKKYKIVSATVTSSDRDDFLPPEPQFDLRGGHRWRWIVDGREMHQMGIPLKQKVASHIRSCRFCAFSLSQSSQDMWDTGSSL